MILKRNSKHRMISAPRHPYTIREHKTRHHWRHSSTPSQLTKCVSSSICLTPIPARWRGAPNGCVHLELILNWMTPLQRQYSEHRQQRKPQGSKAINKITGTPSTPSLIVSNDSEPTENVCML